MCRCDSEAGRAELWRLRRLGGSPDGQLAGAGGVPRLGWRGGSPSGDEDAGHCIPAAARPAGGSLRLDVPVPIAAAPASSRLNDAACAAGQYAGACGRILAGGTAHRPLERLSKLKMPAWEAASSASPAAVPTALAGG